MRDRSCSAFSSCRPSHAQNRFYNELEEWLSGITELTPAGAPRRRCRQSSASSTAPCIDMQRALTELADRLEQARRRRRPGRCGRHEESVRELAKGVDQLVSQMRAEQKVVREWVDEQAVQQVGSRDGARRTSPPRDTRRV